jgi:hypothetical protein
LWHAYPLLGNDHEISRYATAITRNRLVNSNRKTVFSVLSVPTYYKQDKWGVSQSAREPLRFRRSELLLLEAGG